LSANSKKIGASIMKHDGNLSTNLKGESSDISHKQAGRKMSTPRMKNISGFNVGSLLTGMGAPNSHHKSNIKIPIPSYNMPNKLLFSNSSEAKDFRSSESKKSISQRYGGNLGNIMQFGNNTPQKGGEEDT